MQSSIKKSLTKYLSEICALDPRSLLTFRIVFSTALFLDLTYKFSHRSYFFSNSGLLPKNNWVQLFDKVEHIWTLHLGLSEPILTISMLLQLIFASLILLGKQTKTLFLVSGILWVSLHFRFPSVSTSYTSLVACLAWIGFFLPSKKTLENNSQKKQNLIAGFLVIVQCSSFFIISGLSKLKNSSWRDGDALSSIIEKGHLTRPLSNIVEKFEIFLTIGSWNFPWLLIILPLFLFIPLKDQFNRYLYLVPCFLGVLVTLLILQLGLYPIYIMALLILLLPTSFWTILIKTKHQNIKLKNTTKLNNFSNNIQRHTKFLLTTTFSLISRLKYNLKQFLPKYGEAKKKFSILVMIIYLALITIFTFEKVLSSNLISSITTFQIIKKSFLLEQNWGIFNAPTKQQFWINSIAQLKDGSYVDIVNNDYDVSLSPSPKHNSILKNINWSFLSEKDHILLKDRHKKNLLNVLIKKWNSKNPFYRHVKNLVLYKNYKNESQNTCIVYAYINIGPKDINKINCN